MANAQTASSLSGQVTDPSGSVVPDAKVVAAGQRGVPPRTVGANDRGQYAFDALPPGTYLVSASAPDLAMAKPARVVVAGAPLRLDLRLEIKSRQDEVKVSEDPAPTVNIDSGANATGLSLKGEELQALSDDPEDLQADLRALAGPSAGPSGGAIFVDGFRGGEIPPKNSIREIRINQNPFSSEYDKLGYGRIEIFTKPGGAQYHATADYNFATDAWNTRNPYSDRKAPFLLNEFEGGASGPLNKRSSFTVDAQHNLVDNGFVVNAVTLEPQSLAVNPFTVSSKTPQRFTRVSPRVDYQLSEKNFVFVRYGVTRINIDGAGVGGFDLISRGYRSLFTNQTLQAADTAVLGQVVNETRFQFYRSHGQRLAKSSNPATIVLDSFNGGGSPLGQNIDVNNSYELQNYTSVARGVHTMRFGVRLNAQSDDNTSPQNFNGSFTFAGGPSLQSIERYRLTLLLQRQGLSGAQIRALGGGATQFTLAAGNPNSTVRQIDGAAFFGDDWRLRSNVLLSLGLRYEAQSNIHDWRNLAPRLSIAWSPGGVKAARKTVIRIGAGVFYDRFSLANSLTAARYDGANQQQFVVANPDFFPAIPSLSSLQGFRSSQIVQRVASDLRAPSVLQTAISLERQLSSGVTVAVTYTNSRGTHVLRSLDVNAPLPGSYDRNRPGSGVLPFPQSGPIFLMTSSGVYRQNQFIVNANAKVNKSVSIFSFYALNRAKSDSDGLGTFPANPWDYKGEYGPASTDVRHRATVGGSIAALWNLRLSNRTWWSCRLRTCPE